MVPAKVVECCPLLPGPTDVLPLVVTDGAALRCSYGGGELDPAGGADEALYGGGGMEARVQWAPPSFVMASPIASPVTTWAHACFESMTVG